MPPPTSSWRAPPLTPTLTLTLTLTLTSWRASSPNPNPNPNPNPDPNPDPNQLARLIAAHPTLAEHAHFVLVPGPEDATASSPDVLPRAALPESVAGETLRAAARNCHLATNPARLSLCGQSVVIFREQVSVKARVRVLGLGY